MSANSSRLDANQVIKETFDKTNEALRVIGVGGNLVPEAYDDITLTYVVAGPGSGEIETVTYSLDGSTVATLTLSYDGANRLSNVTRS